MKWFLTYVTFPCDAFALLVLLLLTVSTCFLHAHNIMTAGAWWVHADLQTLGSGLLGFRHTAGRSAPAAVPTIGTPLSRVPGQQK